MVPRTLINGIFSDSLEFFAIQFNAKSTSSLVLAVAISIDLKVQESVGSTVWFCNDDES